MYIRFAFLCVVLLLCVSGSSAFNGPGKYVEMRSGGCPVMFDPVTTMADCKAVSVNFYKAGGI